MRHAELLLFVALLGVVWSGEACADILSKADDGWHSWQIDESGAAQIYVRIAAGQPDEIRVPDSHCWMPIPSKITDHGVVSSAENMTWFRSIIEDMTLSQSIREEALFALAMSESDAAYEYIDQLLSRR
jgi:hypothetical protein